MRTIIVGASQAGFQIARVLIREKGEVTFLESRESLIQQLNERLDCKAVCGNGSNINDLKQAGIEKADFLLLLTDSDEVNLSCGYVASHHFPHLKIVIRLRNLATDTLLAVQETLNQHTFIVNPIQELANFVANIINTGVSGLIYNFFDEKIQLISLKTHADHPFCGCSILELRNDSHTPFLIPFLRRKDQEIIPKGDTIIQKDDVLYIATEKEHMPHFFEYSGARNHRKIVILGGNETSLALLRLLREKHKSFVNIIQQIFGVGQSRFYNIKLIESHLETCKTVKKLFPQIDVINADITDETIFEEEALSSADIFVAMTKKSELNIISALYAKQLGVKQTIIAVQGRNFVHLATQLKIDVVVSSGITVVNTVLSYMHAREIRRILSLGDGSEIEMLELEVAPSSLVIGRAIADIRLPEKTLISFLFRRNRALIPNGKTVIEVGDRLVIITPNTSLEQTRRLFSKAE